jgi:hypothetical protein
MLAVLFLVAFVATFGGCGGGGSSSGSSAPAAPVAKAAFVTDAGVLKVVPLAGGTPTTLVASGVVECQITKDATKVVFINDLGDLVVIPIGGGISTTLAINVVGFNIAKNSSKVVYLDNYDPLSDLGDLSVVSISGGTATLLDNAVYSYEFEISDDSNKVVYLYYDEFGTGTDDLYVISINGGTSTLLMADVGSEVKSFEITPNSAKVVYIDNYDAVSQTGDLNVISIGGGIPDLLEFDVKYFVISADSTKVVFTAYDWSADIQGLLVITIDGITEDVLLLDTTIDYVEVTPNSAKIVYVDNLTASGWDLNVIPIIGGTITPLDTNIGGFLLITNDSAQVVYLDSFNLLTGLGELKIIPITGGTAVSLSTAVMDADITQ